MCFCEVKVGKITNSSKQKLDWNYDDTFLLYLSLFYILFYYIHMRTVRIPALVLAFVLFVSSAFAYTPTAVDTLLLDNTQNRVDSIAQNNPDQLLTIADKIESVLDKLPQDTRAYYIISMLYGQIMEALGNDNVDALINDLLGNSSSNSSSDDDDSNDDHGNDVQESDDEVFCDGERRDPEDCDDHDEDDDHDSDDDDDDDMSNS